MGGNSNNGFLLALCALVLGSAVIRPCEGASLLPFRRYHFQIENWLTGRPLNVHCKSGDDDLGARVLQPREKVEWGFHVNYFGTTLFYCNLSWEFGHKTFDAFRSSNKLLYDYCGSKMCQWRASEYGISFYHSKKKAWDFKYLWDKN